jgi:integrase
MYLQSVANGEKTFAPVKAASAAIAFNQNINLFSHEPTQSPAVCLVREAAIWRFGLNPKNRKEPFEWAQVLKFAEAYGSRQQGYYHLVVATIAVVMFGGMCRYDDASGLVWRNIRFEADGSVFKISFDKRNNSQYRQVNKVLVTALPNAAIYQARMLRRLRVYTGGADGLYVFRGFNGRLVNKSPGSNAPGPAKITYDQLLRYLSQWFSGVNVLWGFRWKPSGSSVPLSPDGAEAPQRRPIPTSQRSLGDNMGTGIPGKPKSDT